MQNYNFNCISYLPIDHLINKNTSKMELFSGSFDQIPRIPIPLQSQLNNKTGHSKCLTSLHI